MSFKGRTLILVVLIHMLNTLHFLNIELKHKRDILIKLSIYFPDLRFILVLILFLILIELHGMIAISTRMIEKLLRIRYLHMRQRKDILQSRRVHLWMRSMIGTAQRAGHIQALSYS